MLFDQLKLDQLKCAVCGSQRAAATALQLARSGP
jgi:hypothetical protein